MKRIGILSDTHSCLDERYGKYLGECDEIWHAGDVGDISVLQYLEELGPKVRAVSGNIDHGLVRRCLPEVQAFETDGIQGWKTHIGGYPGRYSPGVKAILKSRNVRLMVSGHSHILKVMYDHELDLLHVNPGAAGYHGWQKERTLVRLTLDNGDIRDLEVIELGKKSEI